MRSTGFDRERRDFLIRSLKAASAVAITGMVGQRFGWRTPPVKIREFGAVQLPDFSRPGLDPRMSIVAGADRIQTLRRAVEALGGWSAFVSPGERVLLKVNAAFASPPVIGATTHPDLVAETVRQCLRVGAAAVLVTDNPIHEPSTAFELTGIGPAARAAGAELILPREEYFRPCDLPRGRLLHHWPLLYQPFVGVNRLIGLAPVKAHYRSGASMTLKNWYGLLGGRRSVFHQDLHTLIMELALLVRPTLVILDGTMTMVTNGPTGGSITDLKPTHVMIASTDPVAADAFGATLLGRKPSELPHLTRAAAAGAGTVSYELLNPIRMSAGTL